MNTKTENNHPLFYSLQSKNYRLYFIAQVFSLLGSWIHYIALGWLTYKITGSSTLLGLISFVGGIPLLLFPPWLGILIDRLNKKKLLVWTQLLLFAQALLLGILILTEHIHYLLLLTLAFFHGFVTSIDQPLRQALVPALLNNNKALPNAIALTTFSNNLARILGPLIAGTIIFYTGEGICFLIDAFTFLLVALVAYILDFSTKKNQDDKKSILKTWQESIDYIRNTPLILQSLFLLFFTSATIGPYTIFMPIITQTIYDGNSITQSYLLGASGAGAVFTSLYMMKRKDSQKALIKKAITASIVSAIFLISLVHANTLPLGILSAFLIGSGMLMSTLSLNTLIQLVVTDEKRGCVMSFFTMAYLGVGPIANVTAGFFSERIGIAHLFIINSGIYLLATSFFYYKTLEIAKN